jgi:hypothetical protein
LQLLLRLQELAQHNAARHKALLAGCAATVNLNASRRTAATDDGNNKGSTLLLARITN